MHLPTIAAARMHTSPYHCVRSEARFTFGTNFQLKCCLLTTWSGPLLPKIHSRFKGCIKTIAPVRALLFPSRPSNGNQPKALGVAWLPRGSWLARGLLNPSILLLPSVRVVRTLALQKGARERKTSYYLYSEACCRDASGNENRGDVKFPKSGARLPFEVSALQHPI